MIMKEWEEILKPSLAKIVLFAGVSSLLPLPMSQAGEWTIQLFGFPAIIYQITSGMFDPMNIVFAILGLCFAYLLASILFHSYEVSLKHGK